MAAIEHRDGSGPGSLLMGRDTTKNIFHFGADQLDPKPETPELKEMQLAMRQIEVEETVKVLRRINAGEGLDVYRANPRQEGIGLPEWKHRINMDRVVISGHSYGATLALQALKGAPSEALPFKGAIVMDPGKQSGPLNHDINVPILVVHSQSWSQKHTVFHGRAHFEVVQDLVREVLEKQKKYAWFVTAKGTTHPSVTDAPLIEPMLLSWTTGATIDVKDGIAQYVKISEEFMYYLQNGHRKGVLKEEVSHPKYDEETRHIGNDKIAKFWQIHVAPTAFCAYPGLCGIDEDKR